MTEKEFSKINENPFASPEMTYSLVETDGENPQHSGVLNAFASAILHGTELVARGEEGINGLTISNAMHLSSWTGKEVTLPLDEEKFLELLNERIATSRFKSVDEKVSNTEGSY